MRFISKLSAMALACASIVGLLAAGAASAADYDGYVYGYSCSGCFDYDRDYRPAAYTAINAYPTVFAALGCVPGYEAGYIIPTALDAPIVCASCAAVAYRTLRRASYFPPTRHRIVRKHRYLSTEY